MSRLLSSLVCLLLAIYSIAPLAQPQNTLLDESHPAPEPARTDNDKPAQWDPFLEDLEQRTFRFFWETSREDNGLMPDRWPGHSPASIAAVGFALTAYGVGVHRGYIEREQAVDRTLTTLEFLDEITQDKADDVAKGSAHHGFFYHFLDMDTGRRFSRDTELSTVDTALLLGGVLFAQSYYDRDTDTEKRIRQLAERLYRRVDWPWAQRKKGMLSIGWCPENGFDPYHWLGYSEGMLVYIMALGSPTHAVKPKAWQAWADGYDDAWQQFNGQKGLTFAPMFGHQYSHIWVDFRGIRDAFMRRQDMDYFENSRRAAYAQRAYAINNPKGWHDYGANIWGLTASDGPGEFQEQAAGQQRTFAGYLARGIAPDEVIDDGTIAPTAAGGSIAFAPEIAIPALKTMKRRYGQHIYGQYGFLDAFNPSLRDADLETQTGNIVPGKGWFADQYLGIDQGAILLMLENHRSGFIWQVMKRNPHIRKGLRRAGFSGGWLDKQQDN